MGADRSARGALGVVAVLLAVLVATTAGGLGPASLTSSSSRHAGPSSSPQTPSATHGKGGTSSQQPAPSNGSTRALSWLPTWSQIVLILVLALLVLTVLASFRIAFQRRSRFVPGRARTMAPPLDDREAEGLPESLESVLGEQLSALEMGTPRNAIVAAWTQLEEFAAGRGLPRDRSDTPAEFVVRALAAYNLDRSAIERLADLYREARFSAHPMNERHRDEARACLEQLTGMEVSS